MFWKKRLPSEPKAEPLLRCSFCNKSQRDVRKMIAGPEVQICDECVSVCQGIVAEDVQSDGRTPIDSDNSEVVPCAICRSRIRVIHGLSIGTRGVLCQHCTEDVKEALKRPAPWDDGGAKAG